MKPKFEDYMEYYGDMHLHYLIALPCRLREFSVLASSYEERRKKNMRNLVCHRPQDFQFFWRYLKIVEGEYFMNFYHSVARYEHGVPTSKLVDRDLTEWNLTCFKHIIDYPFLVDIDAENHEEMSLAHQATKEILIDMLSKGWNGIFIMTSGMGFHILARMKDVTKNRNFIPDTEGNIYEEYKQLATVYHNEVSSMVDLKIYDHRRLMKCPYSLAVYDDSMIVAHPFTSIEEFLSFDIDDYKIPNYILKNRSLILPLIKWQTENDRLQLLQKLRTL